MRAAQTARWQVGFSVVELMVALALIGILSGIAVNTTRVTSAKQPYRRGLYVLSPWLSTVANARMTRLTVVTASESAIT